MVRRVILCIERDGGHVEGKFRGEDENIDKKMDSSQRKTYVKHSVSFVKNYMQISH